MRSQLRSKRKVSGGRYKNSLKKKLREVARDPVNILIGKRKVKTYRTVGGNIKRSLTIAEEANVFDGKQYKKVKIESVVLNKSNRHFVRRNIVTKGAVLKTAIGNAKVVNRPGQEGFINAILVK